MYIKIFFALVIIFFILIIFVLTLTEILDGFSMDSGAIPWATTPADSLFMVVSSSTMVVDLTDSLAKLDSCSASTPPSVVTVTNRDALEPAMALFHTIASLGDNGAEASDSSATRERIL